MKKQVVVIHGGDTFETHEEYLSFLLNYPIELKDLFRKNWKDVLGERLGTEYEVIAPRMPNKSNAKYQEWKIWLEKFIPFLRDNIILVGHSLGGVFLAKYLSENKCPKKIKAVFLVGAIYDKDSEGYGAVSFTLPTKLNLQTETIYLYHSKDDPVVPFSALGQYKKALPNAQTRVFEDRGHLNQEELSELVQDILNLDN